jgi:hypothetical protein
MLEKILDFDAKSFQEFGNEMLKEGILEHSMNGCKIEIYHRKGLNSYYVCYVEKNKRKFKRFKISVHLHSEYPSFIIHIHLFNDLNIKFIRITPEYIIYFGRKIENFAVLKKVKEFLDKYHIDDVLIENEIIIRGFKREVKLKDVIKFYSENIENIKKELKEICEVVKFYAKHKIKQHKISNV